MAKIFAVRARWDEDARRWWTDGEDIPGLTCEAENFDALTELVFDLAPELPVENGVVDRKEGEEISLVVMAERHRAARIAA